MIIDKLIALLSYEMGPDSEEQKDKFNKGLDEVTDGILNMATVAKAGAVALVTLGTGMLVAANRTASSVDELGKFAQSTGLAFDELQRFTFAGGLFGATEDSILSSLDSVQQKLAEFRRGQGDFALLGQLGVSTEGADALEFFERLSDRFQTLSNQQAQEFGRKLGIDRNVVNLLKAGGDELEKLKNEADELGIVLGGDVRSNSAEFIDAQFRLSRILGSVNANIVSGLIPKFVELATKFTEWIKLNRDLIETGIEVFLQSVITIFRALGVAINIVVSIVRDLVTILRRSEATVIALTAAVTILGRRIILPFLLATTIITGLILLFEDLIKTFADPEADTLVRAFAEGISEWITSIEGFREVLDVVFGIIDRMFERVVAVGEALGTLAGRIKVGIDTDNLGGALRDIGSDALDAGTSAIRRGAGFVSGAVSNFFGGGDSTVTTTTSGTLEMNVNVTGNIDPQQVGAGIAREGLNQANKAGIGFQTPVTQ